MKIRATARIEPPGLGRKAKVGEYFSVPEDVPEWYAVKVLRAGLARAVAERPRDRAEKRPDVPAESR